MSMKLVNRRSLLREVQAAAKDEGSFGAGAARVCGDLLESVEARHLSLENFSLRDLFEATVENGREVLDMLRPGHEASQSELREASNAVDTAAFANITGQLIYNKVKDAYLSPEFIWPMLCETVPTQFLDGERIPGVGELGDVAEVVEEARPYPTVGTNEEWLQTAATKKRGFIVPLTREILVADRTMVLVKRCQDTGKWLGLNKEKRVIDLVTGQTNNYNRNGVASNTYLTSGAYVNSQTGNALDGSGNEWRALEKAWLLFDAITDPNTGEPILAGAEADTLIVPSALKATAHRILEATGIQTVDMRANAATIRTESGSPIKYFAGKQINVVSSPYVKLRSGSATKWWWGAPKKAFYYMEVWGIETLQAPGNSEVEFTQDIMSRYKVSERGAEQAAEPRFMTQNDQ